MGRGRIRTIKPEFFQSTQVLRCSVHARLLFIAVWTQCQDNGVAKDDPAYFRRFVFTDDNVSTEAVHGFFAELEAADLIERYEVDGIPLVFVTGWDAHQKIDRPTKPSLPRPPARRGLVEPSSSPRRALVAGAERSGAERSGASAAGARTRSTDQASPTAGTNDAAPARPPFASLAPASAATAPPPNDAVGELAELAHALAVLIEAHPKSIKRGSPTRRDVIARRIREIGAEPVERAIRWITGSPDPEASRLWILAARHEDALAVRGDVDRIEEALRRGDRDDRPDEIPTPAEIVPPHADTLALMRSQVRECWVRSCWERRMPKAVDDPLPQAWRTAFSALAESDGAEVALEATNRLLAEIDTLVAWAEAPETVSVEALRALAAPALGLALGETPPRTASRSSESPNPRRSASVAVGGGAAA